MHSRLVVELAAVALFRLLLEGSFLGRINQKIPSTSVNRSHLDEICRFVDFVQFTFQNPEEVEQ